MHRARDVAHRHHVLVVATIVIVVVIDASLVASSLHRHGASCYRHPVRSFASSSAIVRVRLRDVHAFDLAVGR